MNKNVPKVRFENFSGEWKPIQLSQLMEFSNGINAPKESYGKGRRMISVMDILDNAVLKYQNIRSSVKVSPSVEEKNKVEYGDLMFVRSSEISDEVGWSKAYLDEKYALFSGFTIRGKKKSDFNPIFMELSLNYKNRKQIERKAGGSTRYNVSQKLLNSVEIFETTIEEEQKIGNFFKKIDDTIALQQQLIEKLQQYKKAMLQKMFPQKGEQVPKIRFEKYTQSWTKTILGSLIQQTSVRNKNYEVELVLSVSNKKGFITQTEQFDDHVVASSDTSNYKIVTRGTFSYNPARINVGSIAQLKNYDIGIVSPMYICFNCNNDLDESFFEQYLKTNLFKNEMMNRLEGSVRKTLSFEAMQNIPIYVPSLQEQQKIGDFFKQIDDTIAYHEKKLENYKQLKKALLQRMFV